jgi:hypothetical protein
MIEIKIPKIVCPLPIKEYAPELGDALFMVWVNPPSTTRLRFAAIRYEIQDRLKDIKDLNAKALITKDEKKRAEIIADADRLSKILNDLVLRLDGWISEMLSQGDEATRIPIEEITRIREETIDTDPRFYRWLTNRIILMVDEYRGAVKKA